MRSRSETVPVARRLDMKPPCRTPRPQVNTDASHLAGPRSGIGTSSAADGACVAPARSAGSAAPPPASTEAELACYTPWSSTAGPFIQKTLKRYPSLPASVLYRMLQHRGYPGGEDHFRHRVAGLRPRRAAEAYLELRTLPGEQAQVDWASFGRFALIGGERWLSQQTDSSTAENRAS